MDHQIQQQARQQRYQYGEREHNLRRGKLKAKVVHVLHCNFNQTNRYKVCYRLFLL